MFKKIVRLSEHYPMVIAFTIISALLLCLNLSQAPFHFYWDAQNYWDLSSKFLGADGFSFLHFDDALRGYLYPFILFIVRELGILAGLPDDYFYQVVISLAYSAFLTFLAPAFIRAVSGKKAGLPQILVFSLLATIIWRGSFFYPLSDIPALIFLVLGTYIAWVGQKQWHWNLLAGLFWGGMILIRSAYEIAFPFLILWFIYYCRKEFGLQFHQILLRLVTLFVGSILIFAPQFFINYRNFGTLSPFPQSKTQWGNLYVAQLSWGINVQKVEANIGSNHSMGMVIYMDPQGENLLAENGLTEKDSTQVWLDPVLTVRQYAKLVIRHPLIFLNIYWHHLFNGLDISFNTIYIPDVYKRNIILQLINYTLWFATILYLVSKYKLQNIMRSQVFLPVIFSLPAILAIPMVMEARYMVPVHFYAYAVIAFGALPEFIESGWEQQKKMIYKYLFWYIAVVLLCFINSNNVSMFQR